MTQKSDELLYEELKTGSEKAFTEIYKRYFKMLRLEAFYMLRCNEAADDAAQDVLTAIWRKRENLSEKTCLKSYLRRAIRNRCIDMMRKDSQFKLYSRKLGEQDKQVVDKNLAIMKETADEIRSAVDGLPAAQREVFKLSYEEGLSHKEIQARTGKKPQTIKNLLGTAKRSLQGKLVSVNNT